MSAVAVAREQADVMVRIGRHAGLVIRAVLSSMEQPLGFEVGNAGEAIEAMACLQGQGPADLEELCLELAAQVLEARSEEHTSELQSRGHLVCRHLLVKKTRTYSAVY